MGMILFQVLREMEPMVLGEEYKSDVSIPQLVVSDTLDAFHKIAHVHRTSFHGKGSELQLGKHQLKIS